MQRQRHPVLQRLDHAARTVGDEGEQRDAREHGDPHPQRLPLPAPGEIRQHESREHLERRREADPRARASLPPVGQIGRGRDQERQQDRLDVQVVEVVVHGKDHDGERGPGGAPAPAPARGPDAPGEGEHPDAAPGGLRERHAESRQQRERRHQQRPERRPPRSLARCRGVDHLSGEQPLRLGDLRHDVVALADAERDHDAGIQGEAGDERQLPAAAQRRHIPMARASQPARNSTPPIGVTAPHQRQPVRARR